MRRILFPAPLTFDLMGYGNEVFIDEILTRAGLMMGTFDANISAYGIVDSSDPRTAITGDDRAFSVKANNVNTSTIDIKPGIAVFQSGEIIIINEAVLQVALADNAANSRNIVYLNFSEISTDPVLTRHNALTDSIVSYLASNADYIKVLKKDDYDALSADVRELTIPLAIVTNQIVTSSNGVGTVNRLTVDMTRNTYSNNRPWFSVVDAEHRSHIGTGAVTSSNIHGLSINDLSAAGDLTFLQVALDHGMIVSKDRGIAGVPGTLCTEVVNASALTIDTAGDVTGVIGARYFNLSRVPRLIHRIEIPIKASGTITINMNAGSILDDEVFVLNDGVNPAVTFKFDSNNSVIETNTIRKVSFTGSNTSSQVRNNIVSAINATPVLDITATEIVEPDTTGIANLTNDKVGILGNIAIIETVASAGVFIAAGMSGGIIHELAPFWVPGSNMIALLPSEELAISYMNVIYTAVDAAEPIRDPVNPTFKVKTPTSTEVIVSGGLFLENITGTELTFENEGPIPSKYTVYVDDAGSLQKFPQNVFCYKKLSDIGFALQSFENQILGNAKLKVFLAHATDSASLDIQIQITGQDTTGATVTETVKFGDSWEQNAAPSCSENLNQYVITDTTWSSVSNVIVAARNNDNSGDTAILILALIDPVSVAAIADVLPVAEIIWDGQQVCTMRDIRPINTSLSLPNYMNLSAAGPMTSAFKATQMFGVLYQYWAEDFDKPRLVTTEVTDTTLAAGLVPTELVLTKIAKGLGRNDTYISRPIPVKPYSGAAVALRFVPVQYGAGFSLKVRYYTTSWSNWTTLSAPYNISVAVLDLVKWQMVVTGPVEGMFVILTTATGTTDVIFTNNYGAWIDGVFL